MNKIIESLFTLIKIEDKFLFRLPEGRWRRNDEDIMEYGYLPETEYPQMIYAFDDEYTYGIQIVREPIEESQGPNWKMPSFK
jgi:hypothetical protein